MIGADEKGVIYERKVPVRFDRLEKRYRYLTNPTEEESDDPSDK